MSADADKSQTRVSAKLWSRVWSPGYRLGKNTVVLPILHNLMYNAVISGAISANSIGEYSFTFETDIQNITQFFIDIADPTDDPVWIEEIKEVSVFMSNCERFFILRKSMSIENQKIWIWYFAADGLEILSESFDGKYNF